jgi:hypothetical protein
MIEVKEDMTCTYFNEKYFDLFGIQPAEAYGLA